MFAMGKHLTPDFQMSSGSKGHKSGAIQWSTQCHFAIGVQKSCKCDNFAERVNCP
jgi:hypothetical protein